MDTIVITITWVLLLNPLLLELESTFASTVILMFVNVAVLLHIIITKVHICDTLYYHAIIRTKLVVAALVEILTAMFVFVFSKLLVMLWDVFVAVVESDDVT